MKQTITQPQPEWLESTPEFQYFLEAAEADGGTHQNVPLTRTEFEALKHELAVRRGYIVEDVAQEPEAAREPEPRDDARIVTEAKHPAEKIAARALVDDVRAGLQTFLESASANEVHVLHQALVFGATGEGGIVESFLTEIGMDMPKEVNAELVTA